MPHDRGLFPLELWSSVCAGNPFYTSLRKGDGHLKNKFDQYSQWFTLPTWKKSCTPSHTCPWPLCGSLLTQPVFSTCSHPNYLLLSGSGYFLSQIFSYYTPHSQAQSHFMSIHLCRYDRQSVPKCWHSNCRHGNNQEESI
jgi:hypothetical protein